MPATSAIWRDLVFQTLNESMIHLACIRQSKHSRPRSTYRAKTLLQTNKTLFTFCPHFLHFSPSVESPKSVCLPWPFARGRSYLPLPNPQRALNTTNCIMDESAPGSKIVEGSFCPTLPGPVGSYIPRLADLCTYAPLIFFNSIFIYWVPTGASVNQIIWRAGFLSIQRVLVYCGMFIDRARWGEKTTSRTPTEKYKVLLTPYLTAGLRGFLACRAWLDCFIFPPI